MGYRDCLSEPATQIDYNEGGRRYYDDKVTEPSCQCNRESFSTHVGRPQMSASGIMLLRAQTRLDAHAIDPAHPDIRGCSVCSNAHISHNFIFMSSRVRLIFQCYSIMHFRASLIAPLWQSYYWIEAGYVIL